MTVASDPRVQAIIDRLSLRGFMPLVLDVVESAHASLVDVVGFARQKSVAKARRHIWLRMREQHGLSYPEIGQLFERDHSTVITGCKLAACERKEER